MKDATQFHIRPARPEEAGLFYTPHPEEDKRLGTVGHVRMDFGRSGNEFWHTWWPRGPEELNSPAFKLELQEVVDTLRESVLKNRFAMERFCYDHGGKIDGGYVQNYQEYICDLYQDGCFIFRTSRPNSMSQRAGSEYEEIIITNYDPRKACWQLSLENLLGGDGDTRYEMIHEPKCPLKC